MFVVLLRFAENKAAAPTHMAGHDDWLARGFEDGIFLVAGSIQPSQGGAIVAHAVSDEELMARVQADPFVTEGVVDAEIIQITPGRTDDRLAFLLAKTKAN